MTSQRNYDPKIRARALTMLAAGGAIKDVAKAVGATDGAVRYWQAVARRGSNGSAAKGKPDRRVSDAITFLRHARASLAAPASKLSRAELLALLALDALEH